MKRIHNVIILSRGAIAQHGPEVINQVVREVLRRKKNPILVLGADGDEVLSHCSELDACDLVYDDDVRGLEFAALHSGLHATHGAAFVLPLIHGLPNENAWDAIEQFLPAGGDEPCDIVRPFSYVRGPGQSSSAAPLENRRAPTPIYPIAITSIGVKRLIDLPVESEWTTLEHVRNVALPVLLPDSAEPLEAAS